MTVTLEEQVECGGETSVTIHVGNVIIAEQAVNGDFTIDPLSPEATAQGWAITSGDGKNTMQVC